MTKGSKIALLLMSLTILLMAALMSGVIKSKHWHVKNIELDAALKRVTTDQIRLTVADYPERSFFKINAAEIRDKLLNIPWVQHVSINKKWPDSLVIRVIEHKAVAVWNTAQLLNEKGEIFNVDRIDDLTSLPRITGNDNQSHNIWNNYMRFNTIINRIGFDISSTSVSNRGGWNLTLSNGVSINIGSQQMDAKLVRLADTWKKLLQLNEKIPESIDLRYTNGYVVKWPHQKITQPKAINNDLNNLGNSNG